MERVKKLRKKLAEKAGFTLVELIVVIAILGILAAVAVPTYTGYIARAHEAADLQVLSSVATATTGIAAADGQNVTNITVTKSSGAISATLTGGTSTSLTTEQENEIYDLMEVADGAALAALFSDQTDWTTAVMSDGEWTLS